MDTFSKRHIGPNSEEKLAMLKAIGVSSIDELINKTIPSHIRLENDLNIQSGFSEQEYLNHVNGLAQKNKVFKSFIGLGYNDTIVPSVILRNVLENPGWYTAYTPYQAEISQGRLEALLNFQTMVLDLTGLELANASLLDEGTAAAEAMIMFFNSRSRKDVKAGKNKFFISENCFIQTIDVVEGKANNLDIDLIIGNPDTFIPTDDFFGTITQYPNTNGCIKGTQKFIQRMNDAELNVAVGADILSLVLLKSPGSLGADVVFGTTQRFGVPMGYGGPHAAYFTAKDSFKRNMPGRIIGVSKDMDGNVALRMALQTREQHIKRGKATSNICTAQALLAVMASMYAVYHGPTGMKDIANHVHSLASKTAEGLMSLGVKIESDQFFDTIHLSGMTTSSIRELAVAGEMNFNYINDTELTISFGESHTIGDVQTILDLFAKVLGKTASTVDDSSQSSLDSVALRTDEIFTHPTFNSFHSESKMMRYLKRLENKDLSLVHSMIPLGSCTMKLNAASELMAISNPKFANMHPFVPLSQAQGYSEMLRNLEEDLCACTGFAGMSLQPNSGAQGEYAGLMVIKAYHESNGDFDRKVIVIPSSAHGTNPASAVMAGFEIVITGCDELGNINIEELQEKVEGIGDRLAGLMVTYPSTHGVYEAGIVEITDLIHDNGGQVSPAY